MKLATLILVLVGCHKPPSTFADASLTDAVIPVQEAAPDDVLADAAASLDPTPRARALYWLLRTDDLATWAPRAVYDPSPWVQRVAIDALVLRGEDGHAYLVDLATREGVEATVRSAAALALPPGHELPDFDDAWRTSSAPWNRAPLALAAHYHGDAEALKATGDAVATGELHLDLRFVEALGSHGGSGLTDALATAQGRVEEELAVAIAAARLMAGDDRGEGPLRDAANGDVAERLEVLDALATLDHPSAPTLIRRARGGAPELVHWYVDLLLAAREGADPAKLTAAASEADPEVRRLAVHAASIALRQGSASRRAARAAPGRPAGAPPAPPGPGPERSTGPGAGRRVARPAAASPRSLPCPCPRSSPRG